MHNVYDVAIVGAGPAGAFFARELARKCPDAKILLIDGQTPERKKPCGGLLAPDAQKFFAELDMTLPNSILADPQIFTVETIDLVTKEVQYYQRHYLNMDRYRFDLWLLSLVPKQVEIIGGRVLSLARADGYFTLGLSDKSITARFVVGADGSHSLVRRFLGRAYPKQYVSIQESYQSDTHSLPYYSCIFDKTTSDSCSWTICKDDVVIFGGAFEKEGCRDAFAKQKARLEAFMGVSLGEPLAREACLVSSPRGPWDFFCGERGAFLLGEAAGFISASSFEGISSALISARALASAMAEGGFDGKKVLLSYRKRTRALRAKLFTKTVKRKILCTPALRYLIMKSGIQSIKSEKEAKGMCCFPLCDGTN